MPVEAGLEWNEENVCGKRASKSVSTSVADNKRKADEELRRLGSVDESGSSSIVEVLEVTTLSNLPSMLVTRFLIEGRNTEK
jgi:hypothetical protein